MEFSKQLRYYADMTESMLDVFINQSEAPELLDDSMRYSVFSGGKRLRPVLCLAVCELLGGTSSDAIKPACAIEMIHTYSLIHDDLPAMDDDDERRGKPSSHVRFGEGNAILAGDALLTMAFYVLSQQVPPRVSKAVARGAMDMVSGQSMDINCEMTPDAMFKMINLKTGALLRAAVLAGAYSSGNDEIPKLLPLLEQFAEKFGLLFQITDDILDAGTEEGKMTFVTLYGMEIAKEQAVLAAGEAKKALMQIGGETEFLHTLVDKMLVRSV